MNDTLERDITGRCVGECRDRVLEGELERQAKINDEDLETPDFFPRADWADSRDIQPGVYGGHI